MFTLRTFSSLPPCHSSTSSSLLDAPNRHGEHALVSSISKVNIPLWISWLSTEAFNGQVLQSNLLYTLAFFFSSWPPVTAHQPVGVSPSLFHASSYSRQDHMQVPLVNGTFRIFFLFHLTLWYINRVDDSLLEKSPLWDIEHFSPFDFSPPAFQVFLVLPPL